MFTEQKWLDKTAIKLATRYRKKLASLNLQKPPPRFFKPGDARIHASELRQPSYRRDAIKSALFRLEKYQTDRKSAQAELGGHSAVSAMKNKWLALAWTQVALEEGMKLPSLLASFYKQHIRDDFESLETYDSSYYYLQQLLSTGWDLARTIKYGIKFEDIVVSDRVEKASQNLQALIKTDFSTDAMAYTTSDLKEVMRLAVLISREVKGSAFAKKVEKGVLEMKKNEKLYLKALRAERKAL